MGLVLPVMRNIHRMAYVSVFARYKLHDFILCHDVYSKIVATISHLKLMLVISYLLSYFQKIPFCSHDYHYHPETILKIIAAIKIVTISTRGTLVFFHFDSMIIMLVGEFNR